MYKLLTEPGPLRPPLQQRDPASVRAATTTTQRDARRLSQALRALLAKPDAPKTGRSEARMAGVGFALRRLARGIRSPRRRPGLRAPAALASAARGCTRSSASLSRLIRSRRTILGEEGVHRCSARSSPTISRSRWCSPGRTRCAWSRAASPTRFTPRRARRRACPGGRLACSCLIQVPIVVPFYFFVVRYCMPMLIVQGLVNYFLVTVGLWMVGCLPHRASLGSIPRSR